MEIVLWVFFAFMVVGFIMFPHHCIRFLKEAGKHYLNKLPKPTEVDPWADWKRYAEEGKKLKLEAEESWMKEALAIVQKHCDHLYHHQNWYTCMICGYEEPWEYKAGCRCTFHVVTTLASQDTEYVCTERQDWCSVHGKDFRVYPISDRKQGPFGTGNNGAGSRDGIEYSRELTKGRSLKPAFQVVEHFK